jgi:hypothetical protein
MRPPRGLFRGHVARRAHDRAGLGPAAVGVELTGQTKVGYLGSAITGQQDVGRLEIAMDHVAAVRQLHAARQRFHQLRRLGDRQRLAVQLMRQAAALHEFQGAIGVAVGFADLEDLHDVGVLQPRHRFGFGAKARQLLGSSVAAGQNHFESHGTFEGQMPGFIDDPHAAPAQHAVDDVAGNAHRRRCRGRGRWLMIDGRRVSDGRRGRAAERGRTVGREGVALELRGRSRHMVDGAERVVRSWLGHRLAYLHVVWPSGGPRRC